MKNFTCGLLLNLIFLNACGREGASSRHASHDDEHAHKQVITPGRVVSTPEVRDDDDNENRDLPYEIRTCDESGALVVARSSYLVDGLFRKTFQLMPLPEFSWNGRVSIGFGEVYARCINNLLMFVQYPARMQTDIWSINGKLVLEQTKSIVGYRRYQDSGAIFCVNENGTKIAGCQYRFAVEDDNIISFELTISDRTVRFTVELDPESYKATGVPK